MVRRISIQSWVRILGFGRILHLRLAAGRGLGQKGKKLKIKFQVAEVKKPLMSVKRIVEKGNRVVFSEVGSYIVNDKTGDRLELRENGRGSYVMDVDFVGGGKGQITVDSGAEENVCPVNWGQKFGVNERVPAMRFRGADSNRIRHYGERLVVVTSEGF